MHGIDIELIKTHMETEQPGLHNELMVTTRKSGNNNSGWETVVLDPTTLVPLPEFDQQNIYNASNDSETRELLHRSTVKKMCDLGYSIQLIDKSPFLGYEDASLLREISSFSIHEHLNLMELRAKYEAQLL